MGSPNSNLAWMDNDTIKVVAVGCIAIVIALLVMSATSMVITRNAVVGKLKTDDLRHLGESIGAVVEGKIEKAVQASLIFAEDPVIIAWVNSRDTDRNLGELVQKKMTGLVEAHGYSTSFLVSVFTKNYWSYHGEFKLLDVVSEDDIDDDWFFNTIRMNKRYDINIDPNKELGDTFVWINVLMGDLQSPLGVAGLGMNLSEVIDELIGKENQGQIRNDIWLVDSQGVIQLAKNRTVIGKNIGEYLPASLEAELNAAASTGVQVAEYKGVGQATYDLAYKRLKDTDWKLVVQISRTDSLGFLGAVMTNTVASGLLILLLMVGVFYVVANRIANPYKRALLLNQELERVVAERTRELHEQNTRIQDSIDYAKLIQQTILPTSQQIRKVTTDHFAIFEPRDTVGGDFYWLKQAQTGAVFVVGDCTGHGVPGALMTTALSALLDNVVDACPDDPARILSELERKMGTAFNCHGGDAIHAGLDAGVLFVRQDGKALFSGAAMSLYVHDGQTLREIRGVSGTIDMESYRRERRFTNTEVVLNRGTTLYLVTDGFTDQPGGEKQLPFGKSRLSGLLQNVSHLSMEQQGKRLIDELNAYALGQVRRDDVTVLGIKM